MLCTKCKKAPATFFYTQNINGKESSVALCAECYKSSISTSANFSFFKPFSGMSDADSASAQKVCNLCGLRFSDIRSLGKVGCPECYNTFKEELDGIIKQIHGNAKHCGKTPRQTGEPPKNTTSQEHLLREELRIAIENENYEEAARLRDSIKALKGEL